MEHKAAMAYLSSFEGMPEEEYVVAFAELTILCDIYAMKAEKRFDASTRDNAAAFKIRTEDCDVDQPPSKFIRKSKSKTFYN